MTPAQLALWLALAAPAPEAYFVPGVLWSFQSTLDYWSDTYLVQRWLPRRIAFLESSYHPDAQSWKRVWSKAKKWHWEPLSRGLMQINRHHEKELAAKAGVVGFRWNDPKHSARVGVALLSRLLRQSGGDMLIAVASYNAGFARISSALPIPGETTRYVEKVFR